MKLPALCTVLLFACSGGENGVEDASSLIDASVSDAGPGSFSQTDIKQILGAPNRDVDILVVVDNSACIAELGATGCGCDPDTPRVLGSKQNCVSRNDSQYMYGVDEYADFLQGLKPSGGMVFWLL